MNIYAVYKGEKYLCDGTAEECAKKLNLKRETIWFYATSARKKRDKTGRGTIAVVIGKEKDEIGEKYE